MDRRTEINDVILSEVDADRRQPNDNLGAPSFRGVCERVGEENLGTPQPALSSPKGPEESREEMSNQQPSAPTESTTPEQPPTFDIQKIDFKKYDPRLKELERLYSNDPDYYDRLCAAIRQIHQEEEQAWRAAGCPPGMASEPCNSVT